MAVISTVTRNKEGSKKPTRHYSTKQEKYVAKEFNATRTKNSGATMFQKGDLLMDKFLLECKTKTSDADSISIKKEWLEKIVKESLMMGKDYCALIFNFGPSSQKNYVIIDEDTFKELTKDEQ